VIPTYRISRERKRGCLKAGIWLWGFLLISPGVESDQFLISHPDVAAEALTLNSTRLMFSMQLRQWPDGMPTHVFVLPDNNQTHRAFAKDRLSLYPRQLRRVWDRQLYSGTGQVPETVPNEQAMRRRVAETPGSLGYISSETIDDSVKVLEIR
jgi:hypothetical protein